MRLRLSASGLQRAQEAYRKIFISQVELAKEAQVDRTSVYRFFKQDIQNLDTFDKICIALGLTWHDVGEEALSSSGFHNPSGLEITDGLVQQVREKICEKIQHDCGTVPLWGYNPGRPMADMFIDINLTPSPHAVDEHILDEHAIAFDEDPDTFGRISYQTSVQPISGRAAVQTFNRMLVYGKPGSGKTTYLHWVALQCINGNLFPELVPIFIPFGEFLEEDYKVNLKAHIIKYFAIAQIEQAETRTERLLAEGRLLILFDGFDELPENTRRTIQAQLRELISQFRHCHFIISCRPPLRIHNLIGFETLEIAEFRQPQIKAFAKRWFELIASYDQSDRFMERLKRHRAISELAKTPLLLPMLCNVFNREGEFPMNRITLYRKGFDILFEEWNEARFRQSDAPNPYSQLPTKAKKALLSVIATNFFKQGKTLFYRNELEHTVENFFQDVLSMDTLSLDPTDILEAIEFQHGLVVRRAANYFSFSHLTFQEYLTAVYLVSKQEQATVYPYILDDRWRFVIEIISELLHGDRVDDFLMNMKYELDNLLKPYGKLQEFVDWLNQFVGQTSEEFTSSQPYKNTLLRAIYFVFCIEDVGRISGFTSLNRRKELEFPDYYSAPSMISNQLLDMHSLLFRIFHAKATDPTLFFTAIKKIPRLVNSVESLKLKASVEAWSFQVEQQLSNYPNQTEWWHARHAMWKDRVRQFLSQHFQVKCDWNFSDDEKNLLRQYYGGTKLLAECLNLSHSSKSTYHQIANSLLRNGL
ncbi:MULTISPECIES: NACHT domain-containing protein [unclassified Leptolyngbya]|uniref:NACHT domain-containing protein n=1 Tax=unclassified Leptolyngbya TaxID=2650499 RepID=UPI001684F8AE|nr:MULTISPECIES: NACHT domain-containing protein [unclassified Leptolyngbya]MBD1913341.1 NACHT domain-containing protein [Leptolyngbya sp. FACHB-8]MBD2154496.1 NACHT domain-containing protein [Leptolyngbya sp. FACHB-16]